MNFMELLDFQNQLTSLQSDLHEATANFTSIVGADLNAIDGVYVRKLAATKPEIMVYGIYNAGKSSILNELIGEDRALVNDKPTTDAVDYYDWNGYRIADTPGVGAPIKHEEITQEHLRHADVVIFVISSSGAFELGDNYTRMKAIVDAGKNLIIVLNRKGGESEAELQAIKRKVDANMRQMGIDNVDERFHIVEVNALTARKGRLEHKARLVEASNIGALANVIRQELKRTNSFVILGHAVTEIEEHLRHMLGELAQRDTDAEGKGLEKLLRRISEERKSLSEAMSAHIDGRVEILGRNLPGVIASQHSDAEIADAVQKAVDKEQALILARFTEELTILQENVHAEVNEFMVNMEQHHVNLSGMRFQAPDFDPKAETFSGINIDGGDGSGMGKAAFDLAKAEATSRAATAMVERMVASQLGKQVLKTGVGKVAARFIPYIGPIITIGMLALDLIEWIGSNKENEQRRQQIEAHNAAVRQQAEAKQQAEQELRQTCKYAALDVGDHLRLAIEQNLNEFITQLTAPIKEQFTQKQDEATALRAAIAAVSDIYNRYGSLKLSLIKQ